MLSLINPFKKPSAKSMAQEELEETQRQRLIHESAKTYHQKMAEYYAEKEARLSRYLGAEAKNTNVAFLKDGSHG